MVAKQIDLPIFQRDNWLADSAEELNIRHELYLERLAGIEGSSGSIIDYANGYNYFGFHRDEELKGTWFREWLPGAHEVYLFGDFNNWQRRELMLGKGSGGVWSVFVPDSMYEGRLNHGALIKMVVCGDNGEHERIPSHIRRVIQDDTTKDFVGQLWFDQPFEWSDHKFQYEERANPLIYEAHIGMAQEDAKVGSYREFTELILPRIKELGYNAIQLMAIAEHPYYGSFGYHVSNLYAPSSRFGTPEELKYLINTAHNMGIAVIMDIVHSHYVKNINEGINELDGTDHHYSPAGDAGYQPYWDSKLYDYAKPQVQHFLLSNVKYWMDEFHFDGYRFDGVTSMIYKHHGYTEFESREDYFSDTANRDAICYLSLANKLVHSINSRAITIAEDVSGMPAMCYPCEEGGVGFDFRLAMAIPDFWIELLMDYKDEEWNIWDIWNHLTDRLSDVGTISYAESHDQALVGDQTIAFRLMGAAMYSDMAKDKSSLIVDRGMALHKIIRLVTITLGGQGYLNFMGNEFGHPEWIDFPREGNNWSNQYARRQWSLVDNEHLKYSLLNNFDKALISMVNKFNLLNQGYAYQQKMDEESQTMIYSYPGLVFVVNWSPCKSHSDYIVPVGEPGTYRVLLSTDDEEFGGFGRIDHSVRHFSSPTNKDNSSHAIKVYNIPRVATIYIKE